ncbi:MAG: Uma2 family endonuclease [Armatimonadetes bacterium]|nr:Uma2 family endonuclease [Armatimonadota bacterium]
MGALPKWDEYVSEEEYFEILEKSEQGIDWIDGRLYPRHDPYCLMPQGMAGASDAHIDITVDLTVSLAGHLCGSSCFVVNQDQKIKSGNSYSFPDITIYCGQREKDEQGNLTNPVVIIEVLSPGTEDYDRSKKWEKLRELETLQDYLLVSQNRLLVEHRHRRDATHWDLIYYNRPDNHIALESVGIVLAVSEIYERVRFDT